LAAEEQGIILVAAAGNGGPQAPPTYPAASPNMIAVTATDNRDQLFSNACRGLHISVAAPGVDVMAPATAGTYQVVTGTSIASECRFGAKTKTKTAKTKKTDFKGFQALYLLSEVGYPQISPVGMQKCPFYRGLKC
jgi:subtilisin family serine protease